MKSKLSKYKQCKCCLLYKERNMFYKSSANKDGLVSYCKPCAASKIKKWKKSEKFHKWNQAYKLKNYGINTESYQNLLKLQNGKCAICKLARYRGKDTTLHIDHDHKTGQVRGLLCYVCNTTLGKFEKWKQEIELYLKGEQ